MAHRSKNDPDCLGRLDARVATKTVRAEPARVILPCEAGEGTARSAVEGVSDESAETDCQQRQAAARWRRLLRRPPVGARFIEVESSPTSLRAKRSNPDLRIAAVAASRSQRLRVACVDRSPDLPRRRPHGGENFRSRWAVKDAPIRRAAIGGLGSLTARRLRKQDASTRSTALSAEARRASPSRRHRKARPGGRGRKRRSDRAGRIGEGVSCRRNAVMPLSTNPLLASLYA